MLIKLPTSKGSVDIEVFEREAPLASRCLKQQISSSAWDKAEFGAVSRESIILAHATGVVPQLARENHKMKFTRRGLVAYGKNASSELIFCRTNDPPNVPVGTVIGQLTNESLFTLESIASGPQENGRLLFPVKIGTKKATKAEPAPKRKRTLNIQMADESSEQLQRVLDFETRLKELR